MKRRFLAIVFAAAILAAAATGAFATSYADVVTPVANSEADTDGIAIGGVHAADFDMTFTYSHQFADPAWVHQWERATITYRTTSPTVNSANASSPLAGGYAFYFLPRPDLVYGVILKDPAGTNLLLTQKTTLGIEGIDWAQPQQIRIKVTGTLHEAWFGTTKVMEINDSSNLGGGYITAGSWIGGDTFQNINIDEVVPEPGSILALAAGLLGTIGTALRRRK